MSKINGLSSETCERIKTISDEMGIATNVNKDTSWFFNSLIGEMTELKDELVDDNTDAIKDELGDVIYNLVLLIDSLGIDMESCANSTLTKVANRLELLKSGISYEEIKRKEKSTND